MEKKIDELAQELGLTSENLGEMSLTDEDLEMVSGGVGSAFSEEALLMDTTIITSTTVIIDDEG